MEMNVRRLAALDLHGLRGTATRRRLILVEFVVGAVGCIAVGLWAALASSQLLGHLFGLWLITAGLNYVPLAGHALSLVRDGRLAAELAGVDLDRELRRYSVTGNLSVAVPLLVVVLAIMQWRRGAAPPPARATD